ncbi:MAG: NAD(P)/FAD-dependent oxidoreductase [Bacteroidales bacterium]|nr:NAD(P)/FAD-dependent oxidoreductase [Bacteroidales bacterium]
MKIWIPEFSMFFMLFTFAYLHKRNAGYPIGGSTPMSEALESRYKKLGGIIHYSSRVSKIITEDDRAAGVILEDGTVHRASRVISAADGHSTIYSMLGGRYGDKTTFEPYEKWPSFSPLIFISLGVNRSFADEPRAVSGFVFYLKEPVNICGTVRDNLSVRIHNQDPTLAPPGKTSLSIMLDTDYEYWKNLSEDRRAYKAKKEETGAIIVGLLEQRFPGITDKVEVSDVATPITFERYTGNWKGSFEGWLITPENAKVLIKPMSQSIPGLSSFYMCGQWVEPGGGLPTAINSGRRLIKRICREDSRKFMTEENR